MPRNKQRPQHIAELLNAIVDDKLVCSEGGLDVLPSEIGLLRSIRQLVLDDTQLTTLPSEIGQLTNLEELSVQRTQLTTLPPEIGQLVNLRTLRLTGTQLTTLPPDIGRLVKLESLSLKRAPLRVLPSEVGQLKNLEILDLELTSLTTLPPEIGQLTRLKVLSLNDVKLTVLPPEIAKITSLEQLSLERTFLAALPPEIGQLINLRTLSLTGTQLTTLPPEIGRLTKLKDLVLTTSLLDTLPPEIGQLTNLRTLSLAENELTALPPTIGRLTNLSRLILSRNRLTMLPPEIGQLTNLTELTLDGNRLIELPRQLAGLLVGRLNLSVRSNPLHEPLPELVQRGAEALAAYLRSLEDATRQYEAKILLVGEGNVGKTSLIAALSNAPFVDGRPTTHGIEIRPLIVRHPELDLDMTLRTWDFGGQEVYRISHQFFFSRRALYLVVWNAREGQEQDEVDGWMRRIRLRVGGDARLLIVATHCDERRPELDYSLLKRIFHGLLSGKFEVDNRSGHGICELRDGIAAESALLPQMGQLLSPRWVAARDDILSLARTAPQISYTDFCEVCRGHGVDGNEILTLAELMHDLGHIIYYGEDEGLRDFVVLDPEWLTKAISYVLEDPTIRQSNGILDHARLSEIWYDRSDGMGYDTSYYPYFLRLMEKFDVSYRLEDNEYRSLVAQLVTHERPDVPWNTETPLQNGFRRLALICKLSEPVPGLMAWLTVRHHRDSTGKHWRSGVFLRHPIAAYASEAFLELQTPEQLIIDVRAPSPDLYFNVIRDSVEDLFIRRWPGLSYTFFLPCRTVFAHGHRCGGQFPLRFLLGYREQGGTHAPCHECFTNWDISELLTGFSQPDQALLPQLVRLHDEVTNVARGVTRLESYAADSADSMRRVLRVVSTEITDCPRLFTISSPKSPSGYLRLRKAFQREYRLVLWCEHPGHWHPWPPANYTLREPKDWLVRIAPYAVLALKALQVAVPITATIASIALSGEQLKRAQDELEQMKSLVEEFPDYKIDDRDQAVLSTPGNALSPAEGEAARALRVTVFAHDHTRAFGGLRRVQSPSGDLLWVCADHYPSYDPGLPSIP